MAIELGLSRKRKWTKESGAACGVWHVACSKCPVASGICIAIAELTKRSTDLHLTTETGTAAIIIYTQDRERVRGGDGGKGGRKVHSPRPLRSNC